MRKVLLVAVISLCAVFFRQTDAVAQQHPPLQDVLNALNTSYTNITGIIPSRYDFSDGSSGNYINDGGNDMYDGGNYLNTNLASSINYSDNTVATHSGFGSGTGQYFTRKHTGLFVMAADLNNVSYFEITGNNGADGGGSYDGSVLTYTTGGVTYYGFVKRVYNAGDPSINHLIIVPGGSSASHYYASSTDNDQHRVENLSSYTRIYYLLYARSSGGYIDNTSTQSIMEAFINLLPPVTLAGDNCSNPVDLSSLTSPYNGTTTNYEDDIFNCRIGSPDRVFFIDVPDGVSVDIWQSWNDFDSYHYMGYGPTCPGTTQLFCVSDPDTAHSVWTNNTGSVQRVWYIVDGNNSSGDFTLRWQLNCPVIAAPTAANANPDTIFCGSSTDLSATTLGNSIFWYDTVAGGTPIGTSTNGSSITVSPTTTQTYYAESQILFPNSQVFGYTGSQQTWTVPQGVYSVTAEVYGAQGGDGSYGTGGYGGRVIGTIGVTPGQTLNIYVGGQPNSCCSGGYNGGGNTGSYNSYGRGGGGASDIRIGGTSLSDRVIVAGGGGGAGSYYGSNCSNNDGGHGGASTGANGTWCGSYNASYAGGGATQSAGGAGASGGGNAGTSGTGGDGNYYDGGGGGGGYFGGGGGYYGGAGGGGSNWANTQLISSVSTDQGVQSGHGQVILSWGSSMCASSSRTPVLVTVNPPLTPVNTSSTPDTIYCGSTAQISAVSSGNTILWYDAQTGGSLIGSCPSGDSITVNPSSTTTYWAEAAASTN